MALTWHEFMETQNIIVSVRVGAYGGQVINGVLVKILHITHPVIISPVPESIIKIDMPSN